MSQNKIVPDPERVLLGFKRDMIKFLDDLVLQLPRVACLVTMRIFIKDRLDPNVAMNRLLLMLEKNDGEARAIVEARDESFFLVGNRLEVTDDNMASLEELRGIWRSGALAAGDKESIWKWVDRFMLWADHYSNAVQALAERCE